MSSRSHETPASLSRSKRGRPPRLPEHTRRQRILDAAELVFTSIGYGAATMEEVARAAGMSKKTIYGLFPDKRALFTALINVVEVYPTEALHTDPASSRKELRARLRSLAELALSRRQVEMTRLVISEARHCPELADEFHAKGVEKCTADLVQALHSFQAANPDIDIIDPESTAITLFAAAIGDLHFRALLGEPPVSRRKLERHIDRAMNLVLPDIASRQTPRRSASCPSSRGC